MSLLNLTGRTVVPHITVGRKRSDCPVDMPTALVLMLEHGFYWTGGK